MKCYFCGADASTVCRLCRRPVCSNHSTAKGICRVCVEAVCKLCGERLAVASCISCRRPVCDYCSTEVKPGIRLCSTCAATYHQVEEIVNAAWESVGRVLASLSLLASRRPRRDKV